MPDKNPPVDPEDDNEELDAPKQPITRKADNASYLEAELKAARDSDAKRRIALKSQKSEFMTAIEAQNANIVKLTEAMEAERKARLDAEARFESEKVQNVRATLAAKYGLPAEIARRLQGSTPEELEADAAELAKLPQFQTKPTIKGPVLHGFKVSPGNAGEQPTTSDLARQVRDRIGGGKVTPDNNPLWDVNFHIEKGGGVITDE